MRSRAYHNAMNSSRVTWEEVNLETAKKYYNQGEGRDVLIDFNQVNTSSVNIASDFEDVTNWLYSQQLDSGGCKSTSKSFEKAKYS